MLVRLNNHYPWITDYYTFRNNVSKLLDKFMAGDTEYLRFSPILLRNDLIDQGDKLLLVAEIPGVNKDDIKISLNGDILTIFGKRKDFQISDDAQWIKKERILGEFSRTIQLPVEINSESIKAEFENGILKIVLPKSEKAKPKEIEINIK